MLRWRPISMEMRWSNRLADAQLTPLSWIVEGWRDMGYGEVPIRPAVAEVSG